MTAVSYLLGGAVVGFFAKGNAHVAEIALHGFHIVATSFTMTAFNVFASGWFTALNDGKTSAILSFCRTIVFMVLPVLVLPRIFEMDGVWLSITVGEVECIILSVNDTYMDAQEVMHMTDYSKITALYSRLSVGDEDRDGGESNSIQNQELICKGWFLPPNTYDCGSFVVNGTAVVGKELKHSITAGNQHTKELTFMKSLFEQMGGTYRQVGDYLIPNLSLPEKSDYQIGKYGRLRRNYLKEYHPVLYANFLTSGTLHRHLAEIDQACNERMEIIISDMAKQDGVTETLKVADQMEWVRRMNSIRSRAEEIVLTELVYE